MKISIRWVVVIAIVAAICGGGVVKVMARIHRQTVRSQMGSMAGETLARLNRALAEKEYEFGKYPESMSEVVVNSQPGDFSEELLRQVVYRKTEQGFVAFVGVPGHVVYIENGKGCTFLPVKY